MFTLMVKRQHGNLPAYWYPAYADDTNSRELASMQEYWQGLRDTIETKIAEDKSTTCEEQSDAAERSEQFLREIGA